MPLRPAQRISPLSEEDDLITPVHGDLPAQSRQDHADLTATTGDSETPGSLWPNAFEILKLREPDLVTAYEGYLANVVGKARISTISPESIESI